MYENMMRITKEQENAVPQTTLHATITEEDENCATISASDISVKVAEAPSAPKTAIKSDGRAKSSTQKQSRRTRDERKTPTSRNTPLTMDKYVRSSKEERNPASRRAKYNTNNPCIQSLDVSGSSTPIQAEDKLSNSSTTARRAGLKKSFSSNQGVGQVSAQEQSRLSNLARARQYGNRASNLNKSGNTLRLESSPSKNTLDVTSGRASSST